MVSNFAPKFNSVIMENPSQNLEKNPGNVPSLEYKIGQEPDRITFTIQSKKWLQRRTTKQLILGTAILILVMVSVIVLTLTLLTRYSPSVNHKHTVGGETEPIDGGPNNDPEDLNDTNGRIAMIPKWIDRSSWLATPPGPYILKLKTPVPLVVLHHTATEDCFTLADCKAQVQVIQRFHMKSNKWADIAYNFLVGSDGYIYEGRGWTNMGAHAKGYNNISIGIAFIGLFDDHLPPNKALDAAQEILRKGVELKYLLEDYQLVGMRQLSTFKSPGQRLYELIKTWPHWVSSLRGD